MKGGYNTKFSSLVETASAVHLSPKVSGEVSQERGGLLFAAPPGQLKTTAIEYLDNFPKTKLISNITVKALNALRQDFLSEEIMTMAFPDYDLIYKRHGSTASQIEGTLMSLMGEGFRNPAFSDQRVNVIKARCTIVAGVTIKCYEDKISEWIDSGFARRFLMCRYTVANPELMEQSIAKWKRYQLDGDFTMKVPGSALIPHEITEAQANRVLWQLRFQHDRRIPFILAQKIIAVLCWKHGKEKGWAIWDDFVPSLGKDGARVTI